MREKIYKRVKETKIVHFVDSCYKYGVIQFRECVFGLRIRFRTLEHPKCRPNKMRDDEKKVGGDWYEDL